jgi:nucleoside diphosphate kinase
MERTLVLLKPDTVDRGLVGEIIHRFERVGLKIVGLKMVQAERAHAERHYTEDLAARRGQHVRDMMIDMLISGPIIALCLVGAPVVFKSKVTGAKKSDTESLVVHWSFGDGAEAYGPMVYHAYQFAGKYVVVVVATSGGEEVMTRLVVEVGEPTLEISAVSVGPVPYVQLVNKSGKEIDLGNWRLSDTARGINLPVNTIISANSKLILPVESTKLVLAGAVSLVSPAGQVVATHDALPAAESVPTPETQAKITNLEANIKQLVAQVDTMARQEWAAKQASKTAAVSTVDIEPAARVIPDAAVEVKPEAKPDVVELPKKSTVLGQGWERLKAVFLNKR